MTHLDELEFRLGWYTAALKDCATRWNDLRNRPYDADDTEPVSILELQRSLGEEIECLERKLRDVQIQIEDAKGTPEEAGERRRQRIHGRMFAN
jgi:hypothetical protein